MATWELLPNSALTGAMAPQLPFGGESAPAVSLTNAWVSAVLDGQGRLILPRNGGHADGAHNGPRAFDHAANRWALLRADSTAYVPIGGTQTQPAANYHDTYSDGTPASVHSYDGMCYLPAPHNKVLSAGGIYWSPGGESAGAKTWELDLNTIGWTNVTARLGGFSCSMVWDEVGSRVLYVTSGGFYAYSPTTHATTTLFTQSGYNSEASNLALDAVGRKVYWVPKQTGAPFRYLVIDLNNLALKWQAVTVTGQTQIGANNGLGLIFDNGSLVAYGKNAGNNGGELYTLLIGTDIWVRQANSGVPPLPSTTGTWKKFYKHPNGRYHVLTTTGIWRILPDGGSIPATQVVKVAASYSVTYVDAVPPPDPPDPPGGGSPIPVNTWTFVPTLPAGTPETTRVGKHMRVLWDSLRSRHVQVAGDSFGSDGGQPAVRNFDALTGLSTVLSPSCIPAPGLMPNWPDNVAWCHDTKRDKYLMFRGFYFWNQPSGMRPTATVTPSATTGTITLTQGGGSNFPFTSWMVGKRLVQYSAVGGSTIIAHATITAFTSATVVTATVGLDFANTNAIASQAWGLEKVRGGRADSICGRNFYAGDTGVINGDIMFSPASNKWELPTWPVSPVGLGSDSAGPSQAVYDEASDSVYLLKSGSGMLILHRATDTWEIIPFGAGMVAGAEKDLVTQAVVYRSQMVVANGSVWSFSIRGSGKQSFIEYVISGKTWHAYNVTGYNPPIDDAVEPGLVYDDVSHVLMHPNSDNLTSDITQLYILTLSTKAIVRRDFAVIPGGGTNQPIRNGTPFWSPGTGSMGIFGRVAQNVAGTPCWHYRYAP